METTSVNLSRVSGIIILVCAVAIAVLNASLGKDIDSYIMSFILLMTGMIFIFQKPSGKTRPQKLTPKKQKITIATLSISLVAGIVTLILTLV